MTDLDTTQALRDLRALVDHARERHPHFESPRGQVDIERAEAALVALDELFAEETLEQTIWCGKCDKQMFETEGGSEVGVGAWTKYACPLCGATVATALEPSN